MKHRDTEDTEGKNYNQIIKNKVSWIKHLNNSKHNLSWVKIEPGINVSNVFVYYFFFSLCPPCLCVSIIRITFADEIVLAQQTAELVVSQPQCLGGPSLVVMEFPQRRLQ